MKNEKVYLDQIFACTQKISAFTLDMNFEDFLKDAKTQSAVIMQLALIGELAKKLTEKTKAQIDLPWKEISGFRDRIIHDYFQIDVEIVWNTIKEDIPNMISKIQKFNM